jgi:hypothetical protein
VLVWLLIRKSLIAGQKWAFWVLLFVIGFVEGMAFIASAPIGNARWQVNIILSLRREGRHDSSGSRHGEEPGHRPRRLSSCLDLHLRYISQHHFSHIFHLTPKKNTRRSVPASGLQGLAAIRSGFDEIDAKDRITRG